MSYNNNYYVNPGWTNTNPPAINKQNLDDISNALYSITHSSKPSNLNLLDNWYFAGGGSQKGGAQFPVNQRGKQIYNASNNTYTIDRWLSNASGTVKVTLEDDGMLLNIGNIGSFSQIIEYSGTMAGKTVTLSLLTSDNVFLTYTGTFNNAGEGIGNIFPYNSSYIQLEINTYGENKLIFSIAAYDGATIKLVAAKVEIGESSTLAYKNQNGAWILYEFPNFATELAKCQRYYVRYNQSYFEYSSVISRSVFCLGATFGGYNGTANIRWASFILNTPVTMRSLPTYNTGGAPSISFVDSGGTQISVTVEPHIIIPNGVILKAISPTSGVTMNNNAACWLSWTKTVASGDAYVELIADL